MGSDQEKTYGPTLRGIVPNSHGKTIKGVGLDYGWGEMGPIVPHISHYCIPPPPLGLKIPRLNQPSDYLTTSIQQPRLLLKTLCHPNQTLYKCIYNLHPYPHGINVWNMANLVQKCFLIQWTLMLSHGFLCFE